VFHWNVTANNQINYVHKYHEEQVLHGIKQNFRLPISCSSHTAHWHRHPEHRGLSWELPQVASAVSDKAAVFGVEIKETPSRFYNTKYLLTPWNRVLLKKLTGLQLVKKFPTFHGTRRFITAFTSARRLSLS